MNSQLSLTDIPTEEDARRRWQDEAFTWLERWLTQHPVLFAEDVQADLAVMVGVPVDKAWLGPVVRRLASAGYIRKDGYRTGSNGSPKDVWLSLRYRR